MKEAREMFDKTGIAIVMPPEMMAKRVEFVGKSDQQNGIH